LRPSTSIIKKGLGGINESNSGNSYMLLGKIFTPGLSGLAASENESSPMTAIIKALLSNLAAGSLMIAGAPISRRV
jgi:hypothetical protein